MIAFSFSYMNRYAYKELWGIKLNTEMWVIEFNFCLEIGN